MSSRVVLASVAAVVAASGFVGATALACLGADAFGNSAAAWLSGVTPAPSREWKSEASVEEFASQEPALAGSSWEARSPGIAAALPHAQPPRRAVVPTKGIRVRASTVLRLADAGAMPSGAFVGATAERPAGFVLSGVSALGVGLIDGDVLTRAAGQPVRSKAQVIGLVVAARARGTRELGGVFWRNGEPWQLLVEQPYVPSARPEVEDRVARASPEVSRDRDL